jgi:hypothetical protein
MKRLTCSSSEETTLVVLLPTMGAARCRAVVPGQGRATGSSGPGLGVGTWAETGSRSSGGSGAPPAGWQGTASPTLREVDRTG